MTEAQTLIDAWWESAQDLIQLSASFIEPQWQARSGLPGWSVTDVVAHLVHVETILAGGDVHRGGESEADQDRTRSSNQVSPDWTQQGVVGLRTLSSTDLHHALVAAFTDRRHHLARLMPLDLAQGAAPLPPGLSWDWRTLLRNRVIDVWVHNQDVRAALALPGGQTLAGAEVTVQTFAQGMPMVLGKRVKPLQGTSVVWQIEGDPPVTIDVEMGPDGRAARRPGGGREPSVRLMMDRVTFTRAAAGREFPSDGVRVTGDRELGQQLLGAMNLLG